jgi:cytochrome subunit of sulfide dehydrogenase
MHATLIFVAAVLVFASSTSVQAAEPPPGASSCSGCHAANTAVASSVSRLAGRKAAELVAQMQAFRSGQGQPTVMDQIAKGFTDAEVQAIAAWYAEQK